MNSKKNLKSILNEDLKDLQVTEELKKKTLDKCKHLHKTRNKKLKYMSFAAASIFILAISLTTYHKLYNNIYSINHNKEIAQNDIYEKDTSKNQINRKTDSYGKSIEKDIVEKDDLGNSTEENIKKPLDEKNKHNTIQNDLSKENDKPLKNTDKENPPLNNNTAPNEERPNTQDTLNKNNINHNLIPNTRDLKQDFYDIKSAENHIKENIKLPSYIPEGYKLSKISKVDGEKENLILTFNNNSDYFQITQSKLDESRMFLPISEGNNNLTLIKNGNKYKINGNLNNDILGKIINSIK